MTTTLETVEAPKLTLVLAASSVMFHDWCRREGVNPRDQRLVRFIRNDEQFRGYNPQKIRIVSVGDWSRNWGDKALKSILQEIATYEALGAEVQDCGCR